MWYGSCVLIWRGDVSKLQQHGMRRVLRFHAGPLALSLAVSSASDVIQGRSLHHTAYRFLGSQRRESAAKHMPLPSAPPPGLTVTEAAFGPLSPFTVEIHFSAAPKETVSQPDCWSPSLALRLTLCSPGCVIYASALSTIKLIQQ